MERLHIPQDAPDYPPGSSETAPDQQPQQQQQQHQQQQQQHRQEQQQRQIRKKFADSREKYCEIKAAVDVKINMLHENRARVMKKQLQTLHSATVAHFAGTASDLKAAFARLPSTRNAADGQPPVPLPSSFPEPTSPSPCPETRTSCSHSYFSADPSAGPNASGDVFQD
uniref:AH domain-containing protein n=2 Tax=Schistocephalus solidus TaxID=70667 RepID=A0A0X3Q3D1_SCHSO